VSLAIVSSWGWGEEGAAGEDGAGAATDLTGA